MAAVGEVGPSSFDAYEGIRIVIPGLIVYAAGLGAFRTLAPGQDIGVLADPLVGLVGSLVLGLLLYYWDLPARAAAFNEKQPTEYLEERYPKINPSELLTKYLLVLNDDMPANIRNRSLYMGSMYRIGLEMILGLGMASIVVFGAAFVTGSGAHTSSGYIPRLISATTIAVAFALGVLVNHGYERRTAERSRETAVRVRRLILLDLRRRASILFTLGLLALVIPNHGWLVDRVPRVLLQSMSVVGLATCFGVWAYLYVRGFTRDPANHRRRMRIHSVTAGSLFCVPTILALAVYPARDGNVLADTSRLVAWTLVACLVTFSIVVRGHERKLHGVYLGQTRWLKDNPEAMKAALQ